MLNTTGNQGENSIVEKITINISEYLTVYAYLYNTYLGHNMFGV